MVVHRHTRLPIHTRAESCRWNFLFGRAIIADAFALVHAAHAAAAFANTVVDDDVRLESTDVIVEIHAALMRPGTLPLAVEPKNAERTVAGQQFLELAFHICDIAVHVRRAGGFVVPFAARAPV